MVKLPCASITCPTVMGMVVAVSAAPITKFYPLFLLIDRSGCDDYIYRVTPSNTAVVHQQAYQQDVHEHQDDIQDGATDYWNSTCYENRVQDQQDEEVNQEDYLLYGRRVSVGIDGCVFRFHFVHSDISMISRQTLKELLHSEPKEELSKFLKVIPKKKHEELQGDAMNLIQTWVHCVLYYKKIYPAEMFNMRTAYNIQVPVARPEPLKIYLSQFFEQIRMHLQHIDFIEVAVLDHSFKLSLKFEGELERSFWDEGISIQNNSKRVNSMQKEIQYKSFLADLKKTMQNGFTCQNEIPWKLRIGYRMEDNEGLRKQKRQLLQKWIKKEGKGADSLPFGCSLKTNNLNLIYMSSDC